MDGVGWVANHVVLSWPGKHGSLGKNEERMLQAVGEGQALGPGVGREEKLKKTLERWMRQES